MARLIIQLWEGDLLVHEFSRSTTNTTRDGLTKMTDAARGWLQAWAAQVSMEQWETDVRRATHARPSPSEVARLLADDLDV